MNRAKNRPKPEPNPVIRRSVVDRTRHGTANGNERTDPPTEIVTLYDKGSEVVA